MVYMGGKGKNNASRSNQTTHFGIMGGLAPNLGRQRFMFRKARNRQSIPLAPAPGLTYMREADILSVNPAGSGGVGLTKVLVDRSLGPCRCGDRTENNNTESPDPMPPGPKPAQFDPPAPGHYALIITSSSRGNNGQMLLTIEEVDEESEQGAWYFTTFRGTNKAPYMGTGKYTIENDSSSLLLTIPSSGSDGWQYSVFGSENRGSDSARPYRLSKSETKYKVGNESDGHVMANKIFNKETFQLASIASKGAVTIPNIEVFSARQWSDLGRDTGLESIVAGLCSQGEEFANNTNSSSSCSPLDLHIDYSQLDVDMFPEDFRDNLKSLLESDFSTVFSNPGGDDNIRIPYTSDSIGPMVFPGSNSLNWPITTTYLFSPTSSSGLSLKYEMITSDKEPLLDVIKVTATVLGPEGWPDPVATSKWTWTLGVNGSQIGGRPWLIQPWAAPVPSAGTYIMFTWPLRDAGVSQLVLTVMESSRASGKGEWYASLMSSRYPKQPYIASGQYDTSSSALRFPNDLAGNPGGTLFGLQGQCELKAHGDDYRIGNLGSFLPVKKVSEKDIQSIILVAEEAGEEVDAVTLEFGVFPAALWEDLGGGAATEAMYGPFVSDLFERSVLALPGARFVSASPLSLKIDYEKWEKGDLAFRTKFSMAVNRYYIIKGGSRIDLVIYPIPPPVIAPLYPSAPNEPLLPMYFINEPSPDGVPAVSMIYDLLKSESDKDKIDGIKIDVSFPGSDEQDPWTWNFKFKEPVSQFGLRTWAY